MALKLHEEKCIATAAWGPVGLWADEVARINIQYEPSPGVQAIVSIWLKGTTRSSMDFKYSSHAEAESVLKQLQEWLERNGLEGSLASLTL